MIYFVIARGAIYLKQKLEQLKQKLEELNARIERFVESVWGKRISITGDVIWNLFLLTIIFFAASTFFAISVGAGYFASLVKDEPLRESNAMREQILSYEETSELYFADEVYLGKLRTDLERRETSLTNISQDLINAVLATEDEYFREHEGIVPKAVVRGLLQDVSNSSTQTGGSTLTQQLIKNQILTNEVSYERKAKEILLALRLENFMTKEEILEAYLNIIPYGRNSNGTNIAGIETAAQGIFGVSAAELSIPQAAFIAGIPQAPFKYTPFKQGGGVKDEDSLQPGIDRMQTVLYRMHEAGYITNDQYNKALKYDIVADFTDPEPRADEEYPWLTQELELRAQEVIARILAEKDGVDPKRLDDEKKLLDKYMILAERDVRSSGYRIYSTIDKKMYDALNEAAEKYKYYGQTYTSKQTNEDGEEENVQEPVQVGSVLMENTTGKILAFVGGRDFEIEALNHATQGRRSNGSTMKPLLVYAPALEYGVIGAGSPVVDVKFSRSDGYSPTNFTATDERGIMPAREALAYSQNLPALRLYNSILDRQPATFLQQMGFKTLSDGDYTNLSTAIGGLTYGATVEENTNAYATFANNGQFTDAYMIDKIVDLDGNVIYEHEVESTPVFSEETAYMITDMLRDTLEYGTGTRARSMLSFSSDFAAKTGTSQNFKDMWFMGYNPNITLGVWIGYDTPRSLKTFTGTYYEPSERVNMLWATLMNAAYNINPELIDATETFKQPNGVVYASFCGISGLAVSNSCSSAGLVRSDLFNRKFLPNRVDDSFSSGGAMVTINGVSYQALSSTPSEFITSTGYGLSTEFAKRMLGSLGGDPAKLFPKNSSLSVTGMGGSVFEADNVPPAAVTASISEGKMTWTPSGSNDVVGYRVYDVTNGGRSFVQSFMNSGGRSINVPAGKTYIAVAVDITGLESSASNSVSSAAEPSKDKDKDKTKDNPKTKPPKNNGKPGNNGGSNGGGGKPNNDDEQPNDSGGNDGQNPGNVTPPDTVTNPQ